MSGIAGIVSSRPVPIEAVRKMSAAQAHRGQHETLLETPGFALAYRARDAVGGSDIADGSEGQRILAVMDGQLYNASQLDALDTNSSRQQCYPRLLSKLWRESGE